MENGAVTEKSATDCNEERQLALAVEKFKQVEEENSKLNETIEKGNQVTRELIEKVTQEKLNLVTEIDSLKTCNKQLSCDLNSIQTELATRSDENIAYQRQIKRLTDENDQLINDLESLESKIQELKSQGVESQPLVHLEENNVQEQNYSESSCQHNEEITCLRNRKNALNCNIEELQTTIINKDSSIADLTEQICAKKLVVCDLTQKLNDSQEHNDKLKDKIKLYHSKIIRIAGNVKEVKADRNSILKLFKTYNNQILEWRTKLDAAQKDLVMQLKHLEMENSQLKHKVNNSNANMMEETIHLERTSYVDGKSSINQNVEAVVQLQQENDYLKRNYESVISERNSIQDNYNNTIDRLGKADEEIVNLNTHKQNLTKEIVEYNNTQIKLNDKIEQLNIEIKQLSCQNDGLIKTIEGLQKSTNSVLISTSTQTINTLEVREKCDPENADITQEKSEQIETGKYEKLREVAIKLKGKIRELTQKNEELQTKCSSNIKTIQHLQNENDKLQDNLEKYKKECKQHLDNVNSLANDQAQCKLQLASKDEIIQNLQTELETMKNDKSVTETWKKQVSVKVQSLRKELEANNLVKREFETTIAKLNSELESKEQLLKSEIENHKKTKTLLEQSSNECKKHSTLSLEIEDYEHSVREIAKKLEKKNEEVVQLNGQIESQKLTITALRDQNKLFEEQAQTEEYNSKALLAEIASYKKKMNSLEEDIFTKDDQIQTLSQFIETQRSEMEELSTELSKAVAEHQKVNSALRVERDNLLSRNLGIEQTLREAQDNLKLKEDELRATQNDYQHYKLRVQSVLKQNQTRDIGNEERLFEEISSLMAENKALKAQLEENCVANGQIDTLHTHIDQLTAENEVKLQRINHLENSMSDLQNQYSELSATYEKTINENAETIRSLKMHADTLSQRYRQKISEQESRHVKEIMELQNRLTPTELPVLNMPREECEGSESVESNNESNQHQPVPLEHLLASNFDQEHVAHLEKLLGDQENKVVHLTALLAETEQELARYVQMNGLLKEEIRRQQRSEEREKHAENLEYLKNVIFKFLSLNSGDERTRLVPVINTILKLSPEETKQLLAVAKGESMMRGWTNLLSGWSPGKPH